MKASLSLLPSMLSLPSIALLVAAFFAAGGAVSGCSDRGDDEAELPAANAALHYVEAFERLVIDLPPSEEGALLQAIHSGWPDDGEAFEAVIYGNAPFFEAFARGAALERCDFAGVAAGGLFPAAGFGHEEAARSASLCMALASRCHAMRGDRSRAVAVALELLAFSRHLYGDASFLAKSCSVDAERIAVFPLYGIADEASPGDAVLHELAAGLARHRSARGSAEKIVGDERAAFLEHVRSLAEPLRDGSGGTPIEPEERDEQERRDRFREALVAQGTIIADEVFGQAIAAARSNREADWLAFEALVDRVRAESMTADTFTLYNALSRACAEERIALNGAAPHRICGYALVLSLADFRNIVGLRIVSRDRLARLADEVRLKGGGR